MPVVYFTPALLGAAESWRLLRWCAGHGGTELSVRVMCATDEPAHIADRFEDELSGAFLTEAARRIVAPGGCRDAAVRLWRLDDGSLELLRGFMPRGLFTHRVDPAGWLEDPIVYRGNEVMLALVTAEQEGLLRVEADELRELERLGFGFSAAGAAIAW